MYVRGGYLTTIGKAEWFKANLKRTIQILNHDKALVEVACTMTSNSQYPWIKQCLWYMAVKYTLWSITAILQCSRGADSGFNNILLAVPLIFGLVKVTVQ